MKSRLALKSGLFFIIISLLASGCVKFGTAVPEISDFKIENGRQLSVTANIVDDGGCDYFVEQGFCYSFFSEPSLPDVFTTVVKVAENSDNPSFSADISLPLADTVYYVRAYVKNNAGLAYSKEIKVSTKED